MVLTLIWIDVSIRRPRQLLFILSVSAKKRSVSQNGKKLAKCLQLGTSNRNFVSRGHKKFVLHWTN